MTPAPKHIEKARSVYHVIRNLQWDDDVRIETIATALVEAEADGLERAAVLAETSEVIATWKGGDDDGAATLQVQGYFLNETARRIRALKGEP